jgi:hypothetical protein
VNPAPDALAGLRDRLLALRNDLRQRLVKPDTLDTGLLALLDVETALAGLDRDGAAIGLPNA